MNNKRTFKKLFILIVGIILYPISRTIPIKKKNRWIFGSQNGEKFIDNSKHFFEYVEKQQENIIPIWITRSKDVLKELREKNYKVYHNLSIKGVWFSITSQVVIFSTQREDILFVYPKKNRIIVNLWHGMPMKKIVNDFKSRELNWKGKLFDKYVTGFKHEDVDLISSTSDFFVNFMKSAFNNNNIAILGQPRTDVFGKWNKKEIKEKHGFNESEKIVTYMPTHRAYGMGKISPKIFEENKVAQNYFLKNNIKIVWKFHKNMLANYSLDNKHVKSCFVDLSVSDIDPQELLFISDILITDYSSCYIDYMLLKRPIIFYHYDNYETEDNELYYSSEEHNIADICKSESELLDSIRQNKTYSSKLYHKFNDSNSSERIFNKIIELEKAQL